MEFLGIGGWELATVLVIMLVVAGPKRMVQWAYIAGTYVSKLRGMWSETMKVVQRELNASGVDVKLPKDLPTSRQAIRRQISESLKPISNPLKETMNEVNSSLTMPKAGAKPVQTPTTTKTNGTGTTPSSNQDTSFGTWSNGEG